MACGGGRRGPSLATAFDTILGQQVGRSRAPKRPLEEVSFPWPDCDEAECSARASAVFPPGGLHGHAEATSDRARADFPSRSSRGLRRGAGGRGAEASSGSERAAWHDGASAAAPARFDPEAVAAGIAAMSINGPGPKRSRRSGAADAGAARVGGDAVPAVQRAGASSDAHAAAAAADAPRWIWENGRLVDARQAAFPGACDGVRDAGAGALVAVGSGSASARAALRRLAAIVGPMLRDPQAAWAAWARGDGGGVTEAVTRAGLGALQRTQDEAVSAAASSLASRCALILHPTKATGEVSLRQRLVALCRKLDVDPRELGLSTSAADPRLPSALPSAVAAVVAALERSAAPAEEEAGAAPRPAPASSWPARAFTGFSPASAAAAQAARPSGGSGTTAFAPSAAPAPAGAFGSSSSAGAGFGGSSASGAPALPESAAFAPQLGFAAAMAPATRAALGASAGFTMPQLATAGAAVAAAAAELDDEDIDVDGDDVVELGRSRPGLERRRELLRVAVSLLLAAEAAAAADLRSAQHAPASGENSLSFDAMAASAWGASGAQTADGTPTAEAVDAEQLHSPVQRPGQQPYHQAWAPAPSGPWAVGSQPVGDQQPVNFRRQPAFGGSLPSGAAPFGAAVAGGGGGGGDDDDDDDDDDDIDDDDDFGDDADAAGRRGGPAPCAFSQAATSMSEACGGSRVTVFSPDGGRGASHPAGWQRFG